MSIASTDATSDVHVAERVRARVIAQRKRRILINLGVFVLVTLGMVYVVLLQRDDQAVRNINDLGARIAAALQSEWNASAALPIQFPDLGPETRAARGRFVFNARYVEQLRARTPVVVCMTPRVRLYLRSDGHSIVLFDGDRYTATWMTTDAFRAKADALGIIVDEQRR